MIGSFLNDQAQMREGSYIKAINLRRMLTFRSRLHEGPVKVKAEVEDHVDQGRPAGDRSLMLGQYSGCSRTPGALMMLRSLARMSRTLRASATICAVGWAAALMVSVMSGWRLSSTRINTKIPKSQQVSDEVISLSESQSVFNGECTECVQYY
jgi:hypothetical protein